MAEKPSVRKKGEPDGSESRMAKKPEAERMAEKPNVGEERVRNEPNGWEPEDRRRKSMSRWLRANG